MRRLALAGALLATTSAVAAEEAEPVRLCRELMPVFVAAPADVTVESRSGGPQAPHGVQLRWRGTGAGDEAEGSLLCWFLPRGATDDVWQIDQVVSSRYGRLSRYDVQQAYKMLRVQSYPPAGATAAGPAARASYLLQQTINGLSVGCVYALLALAFTMVFAVTRAINLAFGPLYTAGAFVLVAVAAGPGMQLGLPAVLTAGVATGLATGAAAGWLMARTIFEPTRRAVSTVPLIASIGLAVALQEWIRLSQGPRTRYLLLSDATTWPLVTGTGFDVVVSKGHVAVGAATITLGAMLWWLDRRSTFGRAQRACAQDLGMAELLGVDVARTVRLTFVLAGAMVAVGGVFAAAQYGVVTFKMGALIGLKGLTAAILGGIGSAPGAVLGGFVVALTEAWTAGYVGSEWREVAVFALLVIILAVRPQGLLGRAGPAEMRPG